VSRISDLISRPNRRDLVFPALVAFLLTLSPATGSKRLWLSALLGTAGGGIVLLVRLRRRKRDPSEPVRTAPRVSPIPPQPIVLASLGFVLLAFAPALVWLYLQHTDTQWRNVHGVFIPLFAYLLARSAVRRDPEPSRPESSPWGFPFLITGLALAVFDSGVRSHYLAAVGAILCLPGLSLLFLGARRTRLIAAPLALCLFLLPIPAALEDPLGISAATTAIAERLLDALGMPVLRHETAFFTKNGPVNVSQNCSGLAVLYAGAALAFLLVCTSRDPVRRILIPLLVFPLTAFSNALRVVGIVAILDRAGSSFLSTPLHGLSGLLVLWFVVACLWLCADHPGLREALT
jgi:exosortase